MGTTSIWALARSRFFSRPDTLPTLFRCSIMPTDCCSPEILTIRPRSGSTVPKPIWQPTTALSVAWRHSHSTSGQYLDSTTFPSLLLPCFHAWLLLLSESVQGKFRPLRVIQD